MKSHWTYSDIFDLEYFFHRDQDVKDSILHQRDRSIYLDIQKQEIGELTSRQSLLLSWLKINRNQLTAETDVSLPGPLVGEALQLMLLMFPVLGVIVGLFSGLAFFSYSGATPVNVFHFLFLFIFMQLLLLLLVMLRSFLKRFGIIKQSFPLTFRLYTILTARLVSRLQHRLRTAVPGSSRMAYQQVLGLAKIVHYKYGMLLYWPLFSISQRTLIGFNAGLLGATLFRVTTSDLAFGWQSTIQFSSETLYHGVKILALPWSWLFPEDIAYPSLTAIEGSRIILKDGIYNLATQDLVSWWPFLLLCLLVYGLVFRILLAILSHYYQRRCLRNIRLDSTDALSVMRRMQSPIVSTQAASIDDRSSKIIDHSTYTGIQEHGPAAFSDQFPLMLLTAYDVSEQFDLGPLISFIQQRGFTVEQQEVMMRDYPSDQSLLARIEQKKLDGSVGIFLLMESWMPPIGEVFGFIKKLRAVVLRSTPIYIGLVGKPADTGTFTSPLPRDCKIWKQKLDALSDQFLKIFPYSEDENS